jgi:hypothetical protein
MTTHSETANRTPHPAVVVPPIESTRIARDARERLPHTAPETAPRTVTHRSRLARLVDRLTPPEPWSHRPASLAAMWRYARRGGWTGPTGAARQLGTWWYRLVALPVTIVCHYTAWVVARPGRAVTVIGLWAVLMQVPALRAAADAVLPWPAWPIGGGG